jgi:hypothetical protein
LTIPRFTTYNGAVRTFKILHLTTHWRKAHIQDFALAFPLWRKAQGFALDKVSHWRSTAAHVY